MPGKILSLGFAALLLLMTGWVVYDTKSYSIKYKDSSNLNYDGKSIHKNYNGWVENLDKAIRSNLVAL